MCNYRRCNSPLLVWCLFQLSWAHSKLSNSLFEGFRVALRLWIVSLALCSFSCEASKQTSSQSLSSQNLFASTIFHALSISFFRLEMVAWHIVWQNHLYYFLFVATNSFKWSHNVSHCVTPGPPLRGSRPFAPGQERSDLGSELWVDGYPHYAIFARPPNVYLPKYKL